MGLLLIIFGGKREEILDNAVTTTYFILFILLYLISILAGLLLLKEDKMGKRLSIFIQFLQAPHFFVRGIYFSFVAGAHLSVQFFYGWIFQMKFGIVSEFHLKTGSFFYIPSVAINLIPVIIIYLLIKPRKGADL
ncbi:hypothetical protein KCTCHS21_37180 [Cohnella abietis]|uniref:Uncharacterized protein n=1 Tax=Cohnella abietis TaxID=2507935 RepID=A0A3T1D8C3_9BACL|nr:hypothetical protein KCTCHS21_37180 [Cohnella abietis]